MRSNTAALVRMNFRRHGMGVFWSALFFLFASFPAGTLLVSAYKTQELEMFSFVVVDFYFLCIVSSLGYLLLSSDYRNYFKSSTFTRKMAFLKRYPVSNVELVNARVIEFLVTLVVMSLFFFIPLYLVIVQYLGLLTSGTYLLLVVLMIGVSLLVGSSYFYMEMTMKERKYLLFSFACFVPFLGLPILTAFMGGHLIDSGIEVVRRYGALVPLISLVLGFLSLYAFSRLALKHMAGRDLV